MRRSPDPDRRRGGVVRRRLAPPLIAIAAYLAAGCAGGARVTLGDAPAPPVTRAGVLREVGRLELPADAGSFAPTLLALDATGRLYAADAGRGRVAVFHEERFAGFLEAPTASTGAAGRLSDIRGIAGSAGGLAVYVLDGGRGRLYGFDLGLRFRGIALDLADPVVVARFGRVDADGVTFDPAGRAILADRDGDRLLVFDPQWRPEAEIGGPGDAGMGFFDPGALASGRGGEIAVADRGNRALQLVEPGGRLGATWRLTRAPESVTSAGPGRYLVGDAAGDVHLVDANGTHRILLSPAGVGGPVWVARSTEGTRLYVARPGAGAVVAYAWNDSSSAP